MEKSFCIDQINMNDTVKRLLAEVDEMRKFSGKDITQAALDSGQFDRCKRSCMAAMKKQIWRDLKANVSGRRLKPGELDEELGRSEYPELASASLLTYHGVTLYDKTAAAQVA